MKRIGIFLPVYYLGGTLRAAKNLAKSIKFQAIKNDDDIEVVFSCIKDFYDLESDFYDLNEMGIPIRETTWKVLKKDELQVLKDILQLDVELEYSEYSIPQDGANDFLDCDMWIIISDRLNAPVFPIRKHCIVVYDYIQRYVPEIFNENPYLWEYNNTLMNNVRNANKVLVTTPSTYDDIITYTGINKDKVIQIPMDFQPLECYANNLIKKYEKNNYFVWVTNAAYHKNHIKAITALINYYEKYNGELKVIITGYNSDLFNFRKKYPIIDKLDSFQKNYVEKVRKLIKDNPILHDNIIFKGNVSNNEYVSILAYSRFLWHTNIADNGTFSVIEAAYLNIPSLASSYKAMKFINERFNLNLMFFNPHDINDIAKKLKEMEIGYANVKLPKKEELDVFSWENQSDIMYMNILKVLKDGEENIE